MLSEIKITADGSHTLFVPSIDECYHSTYGAIQESQHIFIESGLNQCIKNRINILEIGFGTGLNAFLTFVEGNKCEKKIHFTTLEMYPIEIEKALKLNFPEEIDNENRIYFEKLHKANWNMDIEINDNFILRKIETDFTKYNFNEKFDLIYFDAFSPEKQPEMWTEELFKKLFSHCNIGAILTTYCAKGIVRRAMQSAGFKVERIPGPPGKREILRSTKFDN
jgi:tRNA U34 5-methylaminomethyl-2-thiouridine-forming methyltransferase MnmC